MPKINRKASTILSLGLTVLAMAIIVAAMFFIPQIVRWYNELTGRPAADNPDAIIHLYIAFSVAFAAAVTLLLLLKNVIKEEMFTKSSVEYIRTISWLCFAEAVVFASLARIYLPSLLVAFVLAFLGLILRVVKNVFEQANTIKAENDFTV